MTSEKREHKFDNDDALLPRSGWCFWLVVPLVKFSLTNQKHYPDLGSDASSVWNFCALFSDVISLGNQWWRREMSSAFSGLDSGFQILDSRFLQSIQLGFQIPAVNTTYIPDPKCSGIPDSLSWITYSKAQDSEFYKQKFLVFRNP